ncbi:ABC transporter permease [Bdellovibrio sp. SKB1291214]|uniref:ABC transporter permease n=1 Tax=Bdellovibrio sp. SKB1291214 TaxID=1732569 RepID=UPI000B51AB6C|nr:ABC transporter permease [Bdellovibrio sp. SKB1291214]UYL08156.1 ABC transporter permease [Bdellovibrio sp. SKB1291214]
MKRIAPALGFFLLVTGVLQVLVKQNIIPETLIPSPQTIVETLIELKTDYVTSFFQTLQNTLIGWVFSILMGTTLAVMFSLSSLLKRAVLPFAVFFQTVPIIAVAPLLVIYFGFGAPTVIASSFIVSIFPIIANTLMGLESVSQQQLDLFKIYHASSWHILWKLKLPSAYSYIYSGLKISAGLSIIGSIAGEFVAGGGLGAMIDAARTQQRVDIVFGALILLSVMGLIMIGTLAISHRFLQSRRPYSTGDL